MRISKIQTGEKKTLQSYPSLQKLGGGRVEYIAESVREPVDKILDIGCGYGWTLAALQDKARELWGIDTDENALQKARRSYPRVHYLHQTAAGLPFEEETFDVVILSEVIEHVGDENKQSVIDEAWRVLKPRGLLIFTAPYTGWFAWADHLDFKRRFPRVYRTYMRLFNYTPLTPVEIGHKHLSLEEIEELFDDRFQITDVQFCGFLMPFVNWILTVGDRLKLLPTPIGHALNRFQDWESGVRYPRPLAFNVRLKAFKK